MDILQNIFTPEIIEATGWTLVHSLWQGAIVAIVVTVLLLLMRRNSAQLRYIVAFFSLLAIVGWSVFTFIDAYQYASEKATLRVQMESNPGYVKAYLQERLTAEDSAIESSAAFNFKMVELRSFFQRHFNWIIVFWMLGMVLLVFRMIGGFIYARRLRTYQLSPLGTEWEEKLNELIQKLAIKRKVEAFFSPLAKTPMTLGTLKPVILFPVAAFSGLSVKDVEAIMAHELAHIIRHDYLFNILQSMIEILFFFHPAVWFISAHIKAERESSCDNMAIELTGDKMAYVRTLAQIQINEVEQQQLAMAFASPKRNILQRIQRLQKRVAMKTNFIEGLIAAAVIVVGLTLVSFTVGNNIHPLVTPVDNTDQTVMDAKNSMPEPVKTWTPEKIDSVKQSVKKNIKSNEELEKASDDIEKMLEVAMSEEDDELSAEMMEEINEAIAEMDIEGIVNEAMREAKAAMAEIDTEEIRREIEAEMNSEEMHEEMREARREMEDARREIEEARREVREEMRREMGNDHVSEEIIELSIEAAEMGLDVASAVLENLPLEEIIDAALSGVEIAIDAIDEIDFDTMEVDNELSEEEIEILKKQLDEKEKELKAEKNKLKQKEKELKKKEK